MDYITITQQAFDKAIEAGRLSTNPAHINYAGNYMHMHSDSFKHIDTREYLKA